MTPETPSLNLGIKLWWAILWRTLPLVLAAAFGAGVVVGIIGYLLQLPLNIVQILGGAAGFIVGAYISVWVLLRLMTKGFGEYRLVVARK